VRRGDALAAARLRLVTVGGYNVHDIAAMAATHPESPADEARNWYQWYFPQSNADAPDSPGTGAS